MSNSSPVPHHLLAMAMLCSLFSQYMHAQWQAVIVRLGVLSDGNAVNANAGLAFLVFGLAQILFHSPLGMYLDTHSPPAQASWLLAMAVSTTILSLLSVAFSSSLPILLLLKFLQGAVTTILPPALNSMSLNVIGVENFSRQVSLNERGSHAGTCVYNLLGGLLACVLFPNHVGLLFLLSVGGCVGVAFAVEAFKKEYASPFTEDPTVPAPGYVDLNDFSVSDEAASRTTVKSMSAAFEEIMDTSSQRFRRFALHCGLFHTVNAVVLPLTMQLLNKHNAVDNEGLDSARVNFVMSSMCVVVSQLAMVFVAGRALACDYIGRKPVYLFALSVLCFRCFVLSLLAFVIENAHAPLFVRVLVFCMNAFDGIAVGLFNVVFILVTQDLVNPERLSSYIGVAQTAITLGGTVSGFVGEVLAGQVGYSATFALLGCGAAANCLFFGRDFEESGVVKQGVKDYFNFH